MLRALRQSPCHVLVRNVYLIKAKEWEPQRKLDFHDVWMLDGRSRSVQKQFVDVRAPADPYYEKDMVLRIG